MSQSNRYTLEDIREIIHMEDSPLKDYADFPAGLMEANPQTSWYLINERYTDAIGSLLKDSYVGFPCQVQIMRVLSADLEEMPIHIDRPPDCMAGKLEDGTMLMPADCGTCPRLARWRLERGK